MAVYIFYNLQPVVMSKTRFRADPLQPQIQTRTTAADNPVWTVIETSFNTKSRRKNYKVTTEVPRLRLKFHWLKMIPPCWMKNMLQQDLYP